MTQQTTLEHTYTVIYYYCVNHWKNKFTSISHNTLSSIKTSLHMSLRRPRLVIEQWVYAADDNSNHIAMKTITVYLTKIWVLPDHYYLLILWNCLSSTFSSSQDAHSGNCDIHMSLNYCKYKSGTIKKSCENQSNRQDVSNFVSMVLL